MILKNPTDSNLTIKFNGVEYSLGAGATKEFPADVAEYWRKKLHLFLEVVKDTPQIKNEVKVVTLELETPKKDEEVVEKKEVKEVKASNKK